MASILVALSQLFFHWRCHVRKFHPAPVIAGEKQKNCDGRIPLLATTALFLFDYFWNSRRKAKLVERAENGNSPLNLCSLIVPRSTAIIK
jgi:hypothetical protein